MVDRFDELFHRPEAIQALLALPLLHAAVACKLAARRPTSLALEHAA